ncbi:hypothetical protein BOO71_0011266 [Deinococcus marmoris]|uniref:Uncharacterized protein n=1 Tax=Deinococcus marmoris TaxID=249408 RepID=A0A1U7NUS1_9DEIO|nr:hypothetical protein BOO71_0011266 [Deinococcus marmoris]
MGQRFCRLLSVANASFGEIDLTRPITVFSYNPQPTPHSPA